MAIAVISGLVVSTLLTLFVIPVIYALVDRFRASLIGDRRTEAEGTGRIAGAVPSSAASP